MLDCKSCFHQCKDKLSLLTYRASNNYDYYIYYVFAQTEYIISCYFSIDAVSFVDFVCILYLHVVLECLCGISNDMLSDESDVLNKAALCKQQKCVESVLNAQNDVKKELTYAEEFRSRYAMLVNCNINKPEYHV